MGQGHRPPIDSLDAGWDAVRRSSAPDAAEEPLPRFEDTGDHQRPLPSYADELSPLAPDQEVGLPRFGDPEIDDPATTETAELFPPQGHLLFPPVPAGLGSVPPPPKRPTPPPPPKLSSRPPPPPRRSSAPPRGTLRPSLSGPAAPAPNAYSIASAETISVGPADMDRVLADERERAWSDRSVTEPHEPWSGGDKAWEAGLQPQPTSVGFPAVSDPPYPSPAHVDSVHPPPSQSPAYPPAAYSHSQSPYAQPPYLQGEGGMPSQSGLVQPSFVPPMAAPPRDVPLWAKLATVFGIACLLLAVALAIRYLFTSRDGPTVATTATDRAAPGAATATSKPTAKPSAAKRGAASATATARAKEPQPASGAASSDPARAILEKFQKGIDKCVRESIGVLPGTSPPIPASFHHMTKGVYRSTQRDWMSPVYACSSFSLEEPQAFVLQWQLTKPNTEGMGVLFFDEDGDKKPDRSLRFKATLTKRSKVRYEPIEEAKADLAIVPAR